MTVGWCGEWSGPGIRGGHFRDDVHADAVAGAAIYGCAATQTSKINSGEPESTGASVAGGRGQLGGEVEHGDCVGAGLLEPF